MYEASPNADFIARFEEAEETKDFEGEAYRAAKGLLFKTYLRRTNPLPGLFLEASRTTQEDDTATQSM